MNKISILFKIIVALFLIWAVNYYAHRQSSEALKQHAVYEQQIHNEMEKEKTLLK